ncbi:MAG: hypothetical protein B7C24_16095 [Bacteroidetes bacterium 4572_77]|nr:MAG: hypothetical protein B7C24_16095 [Bacteroidetes bacterium 4572_77]
MIKNKLFLYFLFMPIFLLGQSPIFYEHYTGLITQDLKLTADLVRLENSFSGYYYYEFKEGPAWISSKPIALDGQVNDKNEFVLNEFGENHSFFQGELENSKLIKGVWRNEMLENAEPFTLKATYPPGTLALSVVEHEKQEYFNNDPQMPQGHFHINALFPPVGLDKVIYHQLLQRIYYLMGFRGELSKNQNIISLLQKKYFEKFQNALQNIEFHGDVNDYDWQKSIRMEVVNNESSLLCMQVETYAKTGKRPGTTVKKFLVFSLEKNKIIKLQDIIKEDDELALNALLQDKIRDHYHISKDKSLTQMGFFEDSIAPTNNFYIHPGGLGFYYNVYEIAPFSNGSTDLFIPWQQLQGIVNEESVLYLFLDE